MVWVAFDDLHGSLRSEDHIFVFQKGCLKNQSYYTTGNYFSDTYGKHHKRNRKIYSVSEVKYEWHDDCIGNNRRIGARKRLQLRSL